MCLWPVKNTSICFSGINFTCAKSSKQQNEDSPDHIILHHAPAALLQAEKNVIHLDAGFSLLGHLFGLFVQFLGTFYFIDKIVSVSILFTSMQSNIRGVNH